MSSKLREEIIVETVLDHGGCQCDPPGSGEDYCTGHCYLRAEANDMAGLLTAQAIVIRDLRAENGRLSRWYDEQKAVADGLAATSKNQAELIDRLRERTKMLEALLARILLMATLE